MYPIYAKNFVIVNTNHLDTVSLICLNSHVFVIWWKCWMVQQLHRLVSQGDLAQTDSCLVLELDVLDTQNNNGS